MMMLGGWVFLMSEVPLYGPNLDSVLTAPRRARSRAIPAAHPVYSRSNGPRHWSHFRTPNSVDQMTRGGFVPESVPRRARPRAIPPAAAHPEYRRSNGNGSNVTPRRARPRLGPRLGDQLLTIKLTIKLTITGVPRS